MNSINAEIKDLNGFFFPFEGDKHYGTIVMLPYRKDTWRNDAKPAREEFLAVVKAIKDYERVIVVIDPSIDYKIVSRFEMDNVFILRLPYDDSWARDIMPVFRKNNENRLVGIDFGFNAWGGKVDGLYYPWENDNSVGKKTLLDLRIQRHPVKDFVLEGGSIHTDGRGTLLTTEECLLSKGRNSSLSKEQIEEKLKQTLNRKKVIWLPYGVFEDETNGHVDNRACFLSEDTIALAWTDDQKDPRYERCREDLAVLEKETDFEGNPYRIVKLLLPKPMFRTKEEAAGIEANDKAVSRLEGRRLAGSYVNFYRGENYILLPQFHDENDSKAVDILEDFYQGKKKIIPVYSKEILLGGGNIHCITKQIPYGENYPIFPEDKDL